SRLVAVAAQDIGERQEVCRIVRPRNVRHHPPALEKERYCPYDVAARFPHGTDRRQESGYRRIDARSADDGGRRSRRGRIPACSKTARGNGGLDAVLCGS